MNGVPSDEISALDNGAPFINVPISPILAVVHSTFLSLQCLGDSRVRTTPLLYFWSSKQNRAIWPKKSLAVAEYLCYCKGFTFAYKPLFNCWNSPQVTVLRSVRNSGFRASMNRGRLRNFQILQIVSHGRIPITKRVCPSQFRLKMGLWIKSATSIRP